MFRINKPIKLVPRNLIIFRPGDKVQYIGKGKYFGHQGIVSELSRKTNNLIVNGINLKVRVPNVTLENPTPSKLTFEEGVSHKDLILVDQDTNALVDVITVEVVEEGKEDQKPILAREVIGEYDPITKKVNRYSPLAGKIIPFNIPKKNHILADTIDITPLEEVESVTYVGNVLSDPFPIQFMNELESMRRKGSLSSAFI